MWSGWEGEGRGGRAQLRLCMYSLFSAMIAPSREHDVDVVTPWPLEVGGERVVGELMLMYKHADLEHCWVNAWGRCPEHADLNGNRVPERISDPEYPIYQIGDETRHTQLECIIAPLATRLVGGTLVQAYIPVINRDA